MSIHPLPPYPNAPPPSGLSGARLWFLLAAAGFTRPQVAELTGATLKEIIQLQVRLHLWGRGYHEPLSEDVGDRRVLLVVCDRVGVSASGGPTTAGALRRRLRNAFAAGQIPWAVVDGLPDPSVLAEEARQPRARRPRAPRRAQASALCAGCGRELRNRTWGFFPWCGTYVPRPPTPG